jgi:hypothetical protein
VAVCVVSTAAPASAGGPPVGSVVGASAVAATAVRVAAAAVRSVVRDNLTIDVATLRGSASICTSTVGLSQELGSSTIAAKVSAATCSFVVAVPGGRLVDPVVDPHEVSVFSELGDDFSSAYSLSLACDRCDRHEALLRVVCTLLSTASRASARLRMGRMSLRRRRHSLHFLLRSRRASLLAAVSSAGASADNSSAEMSSRYLS